MLQHATHDITLILQQQIQDVTQEKEEALAIEYEEAQKAGAIGFTIGVIQDSAETALNSSTDVIFTAAVSQSQATS